MTVRARSSIGVVGLVAAACALGCGSSDVPPTGATTTATGPRPWNRLAMPTDAWPAVRGQRAVRGIVHSHSPYSHDACDGMGLDAAGEPVADCTADLRRGMCDAAEDYVFLTDHPDFMAQADFERLLFVESGDEPVTGAGGATIASRMTCDDGRHVLVMNGFEDELMALGLERHVPGTVEERSALYNGSDASTIDAVRAAGAVVAVAHTESRDPAFLEAADIDAVEIYNLHAALDPDIRKDFLGLDPFAPAAALLPFLQQSPDTPEPDLAFLVFFEEIPLYLERFDALLASRHLTGTAGTDVHQNTFAATLRDGERGDGYRRLMRWFSNVALVRGELAPASVKEALAAGRSYVAFEVFGTPVGFDLWATSGAQVAEMGESAPVGATVEAVAPALADPDPAADVPLVELRVLRVTAAGTEVVGEGEHVTITDAPAGAYRAEVRITPRHLRAYLGSEPDPYIVARPWILSNAVYVE